MELEIEPAALDAVAEKAIERHIGARGLRAVFEETMTRLMYELPSDLSIKKVIITPACVSGDDPKIVKDPLNPRMKPGIHA